MIRLKSIHVCFFDSACWSDLWNYGAPMQICWGHVRGSRRGCITLIKGDWITNRRFDEAHFWRKNGPLRCGRTGMEFSSFDDPAFKVHRQTCKKPEDWLDWVLHFRWESKKSRRIRLGPNA